MYSSKAFDTRGILSTPADNVHEGLKTNGTVIKIVRETTNNQRKKYSESFEPRSHFKRLNLIVRVNVVLNGTVVVGSD